MAAAALGCWLCWTSVGHAASEAATLAEDLFQQARTLMNEGDLDHACPKFAESQRLDPASGTALALAMCLEKQGKTASAWTAYVTAAALAKKEKHNARLQAATRKAEELEPAVSRLTIVVPDTIRPLEKLHIKLDDLSLQAVVWGTDLPVDPGDHVVAVTAEGKKPWRASITIGPSADRQKLEIGPLEDAPIE